jgi:hypothetical protein
VAGHLTHRKNWVMYWVAASERKGRVIISFSISIPITESLHTYIYPPIYSI